jgi:integrase
VERKLAAIPTPAIDWREAITFRNWLMLGLLAVVPLRRGNFTRLSFRNQMRKRNGVWSIDIDGTETKTGRPIATVVPPTLGLFVDRYLTNVRPLLDRQGNDRLWIGAAGMPMATNSVFEAIKKLTRCEFGVAINPHQFRRLFASSVVMADLDAIEGASAALGHSSRQTTRDYYLRATGLAASRKHQALMFRLRPRSK